MTEPEALRLRVPTRKTVRLLSFSVVFVLMGLWLISQGARFAGWSSLLFFGLCAAVFVAQLLPAASYLILSPPGLQVTSLFRRWPLIPWTDVSEFHAVPVPFAKVMVAFDFHNDHHPKLQAANRALIGYSHALPSSYGLTPHELAALLNTWREQAYLHSANARQQA